MKALALALLLTGCTAYAHLPGVTPAQHHADLEACRAAAHHQPIPPILGFGPAPLEVSTSAVGITVSEIENARAERRIMTCMQALGYRHVGLTFRRDGWQP